MPAPSLYEVQRLFWESVAVQPGRDSIAPAFVRMVRGYDDSDRKTRIGVYADAYFLRLRDVLREDFPRVAALVGPEQFDEVVKGYLEAFPSRWPSVRHLGHALSEFLRHRTDTPKCLADLAELEWARIEVFDAPDAECVDDRGLYLRSRRCLAGSALLGDTRDQNFARSIPRAAPLVWWTHHSTCQRKRQRCVSGAQMTAECFMRRWTSGSQRRSRR